MHCMVLTSSESDQNSSTQKEISKLPLKYMTGYFCRSVYNRCQRIDTPIIDSPIIDTIIIDTPIIDV